MRLVPSCHAGAPGSNRRLAHASMTSTHQLAWGCIAQQLLNDGAACNWGGRQAQGGGERVFECLFPVIKGMPGSGRGDLMWYSTGQARSRAAAAAQAQELGLAPAANQFVVASQAQREARPALVAGGLAARCGGGGVAAGGGGAAGAANPAAAAARPRRAHPGTRSRR